MTPQIKLNKKPTHIRSLPAKACPITLFTELRIVDTARIIKTFAPLINPNPKVFIINVENIEIIIAINKEI